MRFNIHRKIAFAGALLPYKMYINGQYVGTIKNGETLSVEVPRAEVYYLEDNYYFERNAVICDKNLEIYNILLKRIGGWRTASYNEFYIDDGQKIEKLPSFHFERFIDAIFNNNIEQLSKNEQLLVLCLEFWNSILDDIQEVLASSNLVKIIEALQLVGANQCAKFLMRVLEKNFPNETLPLEEVKIEQLNDRINIINQEIWKNESGGLEEFRRVVIHHITNRLNTRENVY